MYGYHVPQIVQAQNFNTQESNGELKKMEMIIQEL